jgi:hypothetical protein
MAKAKAARSKFGTMGCMGVKEDGATVCGEKVVVWLAHNEDETLSVRCDQCGQTDYARKSDYKYPRWVKRIVREPAPAEPPKPAPKPDEKPAPAAKPKPASTLLG